MASPALAALGASIPGAGVILGPVLGAIGAIADQNLVLPMILKPPGDRTPQDLKLSLASEGAALSYAWGANVRVPAHVIWISKPWYVQQGGSNKRRIAAPGTWFAHLVLAVLGNDDQASPMHCGQVIANGKRIYTRTLSGQVIQTTSRTDVEHVFPGVVVRRHSGGFREGHSLSFLNTQEVGGDPVANSPDLSTFDVGGHCAIKINGAFYSGSTTTPAASDYWEVTSSRVRDSRGNTELRVRSNDFGVFFNFWNTLSWPSNNQLAPGYGVQLHPQLVAKDRRVLPAADPVKEYHGETKAALLTSLMPAAEVPFFRRHLIVTIEQLNLASFGTALPSFEVITE